MPKIVDLTLKIDESKIVNHPFHPRAPMLWSNQRHEITQYYYCNIWKGNDVPPLYDGLTEDARQGGKGHGWASEQLIIGTHMGTHIDAPYHYENDPSQDASSIPLEKSYGDALMLDMRDICAGGKHAITMDELGQAEENTGDKVRPGDIVILHSGHIAKYAYGPEASLDKYANLHSGLAYDACKWFIDRKVKLVGIDAQNVDCNRVCSAHINFLMRKRVGKDPILIVENLANLEKIPVPRFTFIAFPLPIVGGSGSPIRAVAIIP